MSKSCVLAIEHDWRMRKLIQANLEPLGLEVRTAVNGLHSLALLRGSKPDLILLDAELPDMQITHLLDRLQAELDGHVPIIILCAEPPYRELGHTIRFLVKPFAIPILLQEVRMALGDIPTRSLRVTDR
jgi:DNA-binding response OmpR family regulator